MNNNYYGYNNYPNQGYNPNMYQERYNEYPNNQYNEPPKNRKRWPIIVLIVLLLIVGIFMYLNFFTDTFDFIKPKENYEEFDPDVGVSENNSNSQSKSNSNSSINSNKNISVKSVSINPFSLTIKVGGTASLNTVITPSDATNTDVTWTSSNNSVVTVDSKGNIKGIKEGNAIITVTTKDGNKKGTCKVIVSKNVISVVGIKLDKTSISIPNGSSTTLKANITPSNATNKAVVWKSSNNNIATVDQNGKVTALRSGTVNISVRTIDGNCSANCTVTITPIEVTSIDIRNSHNPVELLEGKTHRYTISYLPSAADYPSVTWKSSNTSVATVNSIGTVTGVSEGTATITATTKNGKSDSYTVKVVANPSIYKITCTQTEFMYQGKSYRTQIDFVVYKNNKSITNYQYIIYDGIKVGASADELEWVEDNIKTAKIMTSNGTLLSNIPVSYIFKTQELE